MGFIEIAHGSSGHGRLRPRIDDSEHDAHGRRVDATLGLALLRRGGLAFACRERGPLPSRRGILRLSGRIRQDPGLRRLDLRLVVEDAQSPQEGSAGERGGDPDPSESA